LRTTAQIVKWGNSLAVRVPKPVAEQAGVEEGDPVTVEAERGQIRLSRAECVPSLQELVSQIAVGHRYGEELSRASTREGTSRVVTRSTLSQK
jgi:antitoxin MazE